MHRRDLRLTLDYKEDHDLLDAVFTNLLPKDGDFSADDVIRLINTEPELAKINSHCTKDPMCPQD